MSEESPAAVLVLTTLTSAEEAMVFVRTLVQRRLVACGTVLPEARSIYRWEGQVTDATEVVVLLKTTAVRLPALKAAFDEIHPFAVPELLALPVQDALGRYLAWIGAETSSAGA